MPAYNGKHVGNNAYIPPGPSASGGATSSKMKLLLHGDGADGGVVIPDSSIYKKAGVVNGGLVTKTNQSVFGGSSIYFDGVNSFLEFPAGDSDFALGALDFVIDFRFRPEVAANGQIFQLGLPGATLNNELSMGCRYLGAGAKTMNFYFYAASVAVVDITAPTAINLGTWGAIRIQRAVNEYTISVNGTSSISSNPTANNAMNYHKDMTFKLGKYVNAAPVYLQGWIDEFRFLADMNLGSATYTLDVLPFPTF